MRVIFIVATVAVAGLPLILAAPATAQAPQSCYNYFSGNDSSAVRSCCNASYARRAQGTMSNRERIGQLSACIAKREGGKRR